MKQDTRRLTKVTHDWTPWGADKQSQYPLPFLEIEKRDGRPLHNPASSTRFFESPHLQLLEKGQSHEQSVLVRFRALTTTRELGANHLGVWAFYPYLHVRYILPISQTHLTFVRLT